MSGADWQPGDLALCLHVRPRDVPVYRGLEALRSGAVYTVEAVGSWGGETGLLLAGVRSESPTGVYHHARFRKIKPHAPDAEDAETIRLLTGKPARVPA